MYIPLVTQWTVFWALIHRVCNNTLSSHAYLTIFTLFFFSFSVGDIFHLLKVLTAFLNKVYLPNPNRIRFYHYSFSSAQSLICITPLWPRFHKIISNKLPPRWTCTKYNKTNEVLIHLKFYGPSMQGDRLFNSKSNHKPSESLIKYPSR